MRIAGLIVGLVDFLNACLLACLMVWLLVCLLARLTDRLTDWLFERVEMMIMFRISTACLRQLLIGFSMQICSLSGLSHGWNLHVAAC